MIHFTTNNNKTNQNTKLGKHILAAAKDQEKTRLFDQKPKQQLRKSRSLTTEKTSLITVDISLKRRSTGCLRRSSFYSTKSNDSSIQVTKVTPPPLSLLYLPTHSFQRKSGVLLEIMKFPMCLVPIAF